MGVQIGKRSRGLGGFGPAGETEWDDRYIAASRVRATWLEAGDNLSDLEAPAKAFQLLQK